MKQQTTMKLLAGCIAVVTVLGLALTAMGCKDPTTTNKETEQEHSKDVFLGDIKITVHYKKLPSAAEPDYLEIIQERLNFAYNNADAHYMYIINGMKAKNGNYKIIVEYGESYDKFIVADGQTVKVSDTWLASNTPNTIASSLMSAFSNMLSIELAERNKHNNNSHPIVNAKVPFTQLSNCI